MMSMISMTQSFFKFGINFLKIRSEIKAITADRKLNPTRSAVRLVFPETGFLPVSNNTPITKQSAETRLSGVSFIFNVQSITF